MSESCAQALYIVLIIHIFFLVQQNSGETVGLKMVEEPDDVTVRLGDDVMLRCSAWTSATKSILRFTWRKEGVEVRQSSRRYVEGEGVGGSLRRVQIHTDPQGKASTLRISRVEEGDAGSYQCVASLPDVGAVISKPAHLRLAFLSPFSVEPEDLTLLEGHTARFQCSISGLPLPTIIWFKDDTPLQLDPARHVVVTSQVLHIYRVRRTDGGRYHCTAGNSVGSVQSQAASLVIRSLHNSGIEVSSEGIDVRWVARPSNVQVLRSDTATFECVANAWPARPDDSSFNQTLIFYWFKRGVDGDERVVGERVEREGGGEVMRLRLVQEEDSGLYVCRVTSSQLTVESTASLTVTVRPYLVEGSDEVVEARTSDRVTLLCDFRGSPRPTVTWLKNAQPLETGHRLVSNSLSLRINEEKDAGMYQCCASNSVGWGCHVLKLSVIVTAAPQNLHVESYTKTSITVAWDDSATSAHIPIVAHSIHYIAYPFLKEEELVEVADGDAVSKVIVNLNPYTNYSIRVRAYRTEVAGHFSQTIYQTTAEEVPTAPPDFKISSSDNMSMRVDWEPLDPFSVNGLVSGYRILYREHGSNGAPRADVKVIQVGADQFHHVVTGLETGKVYSVMVLAGTGAGYPSFSEDIWPWRKHYVSAKPSVGVSDMESFRVVGSDSHTVCIQWDTPVSLGGVLYGYRITYRPLAGGDKRTVVLTEQSVSHNITQLSPNTTYRVTIQSFTDLGDGPPVTRLVQTLPDRSPLPAPPPLTSDSIVPPSDLRAEGVNESTIKLSWMDTSGLGSEGRERFYVVSYQLIRRRDETGISVTDTQDVNNEIRYINTTDRVVQLGGLESYSVYRLKVQTRHVTVTSRYSESVECSTTEGYPECPGSVSWLLAGATTAEIKWTRPERVNGYLNSYIIQFCLVSDSSYITQQPQERECRTVTENNTVQYTVLRDLVSRSSYVVRVAGVSRRGPGSWSHPIFFRTGIPSTESGFSSHSSSDRMIGVTIGILITVGCFGIVVLIFLIKNRCCSSHFTTSRHCNCSVGRGHEHHELLTKCAHQASLTNGSCVKHVNQGKEAGPKQELMVETCFDVDKSKADLNYKKDGSYGDDVSTRGGVGTACGCYCCCRTAVNSKYPSLEGEQQRQRALSNGVSNTYIKHNGTTASCRLLNTPVNCGGGQLQNTTSVQEPCRLSLPVRTVEQLELNNLQRSTSVI